MLLTIAPWGRVSGRRVLLTIAPWGRVSGRSGEALCLAHREGESKPYVVQRRDFPLTTGGVTSR